ncbi:MAG: Tn3 family transposase post-transcriptional regulator TnpC [Polaromonas sp.]
MSKAERGVDTAYGRLDRAALEQARGSYDTVALLRMIDELDELVGKTCEEDGLRDLLLRLHAMAHTVINGAAVAISADGETLPDLAQEVTMQLHEAIGTLESWIRRIAPLKTLQARD